MKTYFVSEGNIDHVEMKQFVRAKSGRKSTEELGAWLG